MGPISCPETWIINDHYTLCDIPEERVFGLPHMGLVQASEFSRIVYSGAGIVRDYFIVMKDGVSMFLEYPNS